MDFDLEFSSEKSGEHKDHSPLKNSAMADNNDGDGIAPPAFAAATTTNNPMDDGFLFDSNNGTKVSTSSDDFEHIVKDSYDFSPKNQSADIMTTNANLLDDFDAKPLPKIDAASHKLDDLDDFLSGSAKSSATTKAATMDFMAAERTGSPVKSAKSSIYDEIENDYLNPYASKSNEKFISSEDLLGDFKDVDATNNSVPASHFDDNFADDELSSIPKPIDSKFDVNASKTVVEPEIPVAAAPPVVVSKPAAVVEVVPSKVEEVKAIVPEQISSPPKPKEQMISAEEMFYRIGLGKYRKFFFFLYFT